MKPMLFAAAGVLAVTVAHAHHGDEVDHSDPAGSELWSDISVAYLGEDAEVRFDQDIRVIMAERVESAHEVPLIVKVPHDLRDMQKFAVLIDNNPIQQVVELIPHRPIESIGMNVRLERSTPVRAAVQGSDGIWYVGTKSVLVMSAGGCSSPNPEGATASVGDVAIRQFERNGGASRLKVRISHPMDTGFVVEDDGDVVPAYYVEQVEIRDSLGPIAEMLTWAAMSSDPVITLDLPEQGQTVRVRARDSQGMEFEGSENAASTM